jgi:hypothetical protein
MVHELKTDPEVFDAVWAGKKTYEMRKNDRDFKERDTLILRRTHFSGREMLKKGEPLIYTGQTVVCEVTHILYGPIYGLKEDWCIMSIHVEDKYGV